MSKNSIQVTITHQDEQITFQSKSEAIRFLDSNKYTRGQIATIIGCRYQMVKNILDKSIKKEG